MLGAPALLLLRRYQVAGGWPNSPTGSKTPTVVTPSPFQSPATGTQSAAPYWDSGMSAAPGLLLFRSYQVAAGGRNLARGAAPPLVSRPDRVETAATVLARG